MASTIFDSLWDEAFDREGELVCHAAELAQLYKISSAMESIRLAQLFQASGQPFFEHCEAIVRARQERKLKRVRRRYHLDEQQMTLLRQLLAKATKGWQ
jgi:hypothetical protein